MHCPVTTWTHAHIPNTLRPRTEAWRCEGNSDSRDCWGCGAQESLALPEELNWGNFNNIVLLYKAM